MQLDDEETARALVRFVDASPGERAPMFTNAPPHWPTIRTMLFNPEAHVPARSAILQIRTLGEMARHFQAQNGPTRLARVAVSHLAEGGVLSYPGLVEDQGRHVPLLLYPQGFPDASGHYAGVCQEARKLGLADPVYYSHAPILPAPPLPVLEALHPTHFSTEGPRPPAGDYAMWWETPGDEDVGSSPCIADIEAYYEALEGYQTYFLAAYAVRAGLVPEGTSRVALPKDLTFALCAPGDVPVLVTASEEKGVRFHLHSELVPASYRNNFMRALARAAKEMRAMAQQANAPRDVSALSPLRHWGMVRKPMQVDGKPLKLAALGIVVVHGRSAPGSVTGGPASGGQR